jgi:hypothetical protein
MFPVRDPQRTLRTISLFRYGVAGLFLVLALLLEKPLLLGLAALALIMARSGYCPLVRR